MKKIVATLLLLAMPAFAQELPKKPADPIVEEVSKSLSPEGIQERQLKAIKALADAYEHEKARAVAAETKLKESQLKNESEK